MATTPNNNVGHFTFNHQAIEAADTKFGIAIAECESCIERFGRSLCLWHEAVWEGVELVNSCMETSPTYKQAFAEDEKRPALITTDNTTAEKLTFTFGFNNGEPTAALFIGDAPDPVAFMPRDFLYIAANQSWGDEVSAYQ